MKEYIQEFFTFQSGYIQMASKKEYEMRIKIFTFQSGYIQINLN